jgi:hypothetical protein
MSEVPMSEEAANFVAGDKKKDVPKDFNPVLARDVGFDLKTNHTREELGDQAIHDQIAYIKPDLDKAETPAERAQMIEGKRGVIKGLIKDLSEGRLAGDPNAKDDPGLKEQNAKLHALTELEKMGFEG